MSSLESVRNRMSAAEHFMPALEFLFTRSSMPAKPSLTASRMVAMTIWIFRSKSSSARPIAGAAWMMMSSAIMASSANIAASAAAAAAAAGAAATAAAS